MEDVNGVFIQVIQNINEIFESIWQSLKDSGPCCGIRFDQKTVESDPILCAGYKMRM